MKRLFMMIAAAMLATGCLIPEPDLTFQGDPVVEFKNHRTSGSGFLAGNTFNSRTVTRSVQRDSVLIQLVGPQRSTALDVTWRVLDSSTAVEGVNYNFTTTKGTARIEAGSSFGWIKFDVLSGAIPAGESRIIEFELVGNNEVPASPNYNRFTYRINP